MKIKDIKTASDFDQWEEECRLRRDRRLRNERIWVNIGLYSGVALTWYLLVFR